MKFNCNICGEEISITEYMFRTIIVRELPDGVASMNITLPVCKECQEAVLAFIDLRKEMAAFDRGER